jgi:hypothetical protein
MVRARKKTGIKTVISDAYFSVNEKLTGLGLNVLRPIYNLAVGKPIVGNLKILKEFIVIDQKIRNGDFNELLSSDFFKKLDSFTDHLTKYYELIGVNALIVPNDIAFFEQLNINIFRKLGKPSFIFLHGLPGIYNICNDNQTDYLAVWGEKIKEHYINAGFDPNKILISGHPFYQKLHNNRLRNNFDNILVITKVAATAAQYRDKFRLSDRGNSVIYLYSIERVLRSLGVTRVCLRVHPAESIAWYYRFINKDFFVADQKDLNASLSKATLVIGPASTVFLESIYRGVNYLVYEPTANSLDLGGVSPAPPFDGSDPKVPVAKNETQLRQMLKEKIVLDKTIFNDYIDTPFNIQGLIDKI